MRFFRTIPYSRLPSEEEEAATRTTKEYHKLRAHDSDDTISSDSHSHNGERRWTCSSLRHRSKLRHIPIIITSLTVLFLLSLAAWCIHSQSLQTCLARTSSYSPALAVVKYHDTDFANAFDQKSRYRGPPTPELEKAWEDLWNQPEVMIPPHGMAKLNRSGGLSGRFMKVPTEEGDGYFGGLEVFHQLHCLNYIRQFTWFVMGKYDDETLPSEFHHSLKALRMHTDHCIETLRIVLMCQADVSPVLVKWTDTDPPVPEADFNSHHRCRNFEDILDWNTKHAIQSWGLNKLEHTPNHD